ncbi:hypothetical protein LCGC14_2652760, partial [marine sediment metagenome]
AGHDRTAAALERRAGEIARKHKEVRQKIRTGASSGPGTYPWEVCIAQARKRGAVDPKAVCGAIRAASRRKYPAYWKARRRVRRNPSTDFHEEEARHDMDAAASSLAESLQQTSRSNALEWAMSASTYVGAAIAHAEAAGNRGLAAEAAELGSSIRKLTDQHVFQQFAKGGFARPVVNKTKKKTKKKTKRQASRGRNPAVSRFMRL